MKKNLLFMLLLAFCAAPVFAQDEYDKFNVFGGYSINRVDTSEDGGSPTNEDTFNRSQTFNGFNGSVTVNVSRYIGIKGDYSYHRKTFDVPDGTSTLRLNSNLQNFLGGVQIKDNSKGMKLKPFGHVLVGGARSSIKFTNSLNTNLSDFDASETGFAMAVGGGLDFRVGERIDIRAIQVDYNPTRLGGSFQNNFRIGFGVVFR